jgi:carboxyl-terminal processing protease
MKFNYRRGLRIGGTAAVGGVLTVSILMAFQLFTFQSDFTKALRTYEWLRADYYGDVQDNQLEDPYSVYMNVDETVAFNEQFVGEIEGIGADIRVEDGQIVVISPVQGSPAEKAGLLPHDILLEANGTRLDAMSLEEAAPYIRGPKNSEVVLKVRRAGIEHDFNVSLQRDTIPTETVMYSDLSNGIASIRISEFGPSTGDEFDEALQKLTSNHAKGLILDLRQNPGGTLQTALAVASRFVPEGELLITNEYNDGSTDKYMSDQTPIDVPTVVLIDEGSASGAEVVAAALKDSADIPLIGQRTFGKGIGQRVRVFPDGSIVKYTNLEIVTPDGYRYHDIGLEPNYEVALPEYAKLPVLQIKNTYRVGDQHQEISLAQQYLEGLGFNPGRTDGLLDKLTSEAVARLQTQASLEPSGVIDPRTASVMVELLKAKLKDNNTQMNKAIEVLSELME